MARTGRSWRRRIALAAVGALVLGAAGALWTAGGCNSKPVDDGRARRVDPPHVRFTEITGPAGVRFRHVNGAYGNKFLPETMGAGVAVFDYDGDGRPDLLFINSCYWPGHEAPGPRPTQALYRNLGNDQFEDVTAHVGLDVAMYGMGVTVGDYDNDGWPDVFITGVGGNRLFHNEPDGKGGRHFVDVTAWAEVGGPGGWPGGAADVRSIERPVNFSSSAAWLDYDGDGLLDLFVCNYVTWSPGKDWRQEFTLQGGGRAYGPPLPFDGAACFLYRNRGDGRFEDVSDRAGVVVKGARGLPVGKSLAVVAADVDGDGWPDVLVANDTVQNFFFHNKGDGSFEEVGVVSGAAYAEGGARGAMGADYAEFRPGRFAFAIGNFADEPDTLLAVDDRKRLLFSDAAQVEGIAGPSRMLLKFGVLFFDYDLDGRLDLMTCNGHLEPEISRVQKGQTYAQPVQLFWNTGSKPGFELVTAAEAGPDLFRPLVGRACAVADLNGDGTLDVVLTENGGPARVLRNEGGTGNHWVRLLLQGDGRRSNRSAIGAHITLEAGGMMQQREVLSARGYLSQSELTQTFGLGKANQVDRVMIRWPGKNGNTQVVENLAADRVHTIRQAGGE